MADKHNKNDSDLKTAQVTPSVSPSMVNQANAAAVEAEAAKAAQESLPDPKVVVVHKSLAEKERDEARGDAADRDGPQKTYRVGPGGHYREGKLYEHGELITVAASEKPGREWEEVEESKQRTARFLAKKS